MKPVVESRYLIEEGLSSMEESRLGAFLADNCQEWLYGNRFSFLNNFPLRDCHKCDKLEKCVVYVDYANTEVEKEDYARHMRSRYNDVVASQLRRRWYNAGVCSVAGGSCSTTTGTPVFSVVETSRKVLLRKGLIDVSTTLDTVYSRVFRTEGQTMWAYENMPTPLFIDVVISLWNGCRRPVDLNIELFKAKEHVSIAECQDLISWTDKYKVDLWSIDTRTVAEMVADPRDWAKWVLLEDHSPLGLRLDLIQSLSGAKDYQKWEWAPDHAWWEHFTGVLLSRDISFLDRKWLSEVKPLLVNASGVSEDRLVTDLKDWAVIRSVLGKPGYAQMTDIWVKYGMRNAHHNTLNHAHSMVNGIGSILKAKHLKHWLKVLTAIDGVLSIKIVSAIPEVEEFLGSANRQLPKTYEELIVQYKEMLDVRKENLYQGHLGQLCLAYDLSLEFLSLNKGYMAGATPAVYQQVPGISIVIGDYELKVLETDDPEQLIVGKVVNCCQHLNGQAHACVKHAWTRGDSQVASIYHKGKILGTTWLWIEDDMIVFDSIEAKGHHPTITDLVVAAAKKFIQYSWINTCWIGLTGYGVTPKVRKALTLGNQERTGNAIGYYDPKGYDCDGYRRVQILL